MTKAIYTVITGGYDKIKPAPIFKGWDTILFTDNLEIDSKGWEVRPVDLINEPLIESRRIKILSHEVLPEYDLVCYIDGNQIFLREPPSYPIWFNHPRRSTIFHEAEQLVVNGRFNESDIYQMTDYYKSCGYSDEGL